jgi:hypothetical protein
MCALKNKADNQYASLLSYNTLQGKVNSVCYEIFPDKTKQEDIRSPLKSGLQNFLNPVSRHLLLVFTA